ncbi:MAG TPA: S8 family serine peptidase [Xanthomonadaceae bacterium]
MTRKVSRLSAAIAVSLTWLVLPLSANAAEYRTVKEPVDGQYIVVLKDTAARLAGESNRFASPVDMVATGIASSYHVTVLQSYDRVLRGFAIRASNDALLRMLKDSRIAYIQEDAVAHASTTQTANLDWGLDRIDQRNLPLDKGYTYTTTASNVHAYVIDTGILGTHTDFTGRMGNGGTYINDGNGTKDCNGHGTHVAGTLGGTNYGVAKGVTLHPVRVLDCSGAGTASQVISGMNWVAGHHISPAVANMSLDFSDHEDLVDSALDSLTASGVTVVVAAGNHISNGPFDACHTTGTTGISPADAATAITVGSTRQDDGISSFSNVGSCLKLFAPGSQIISDWNTSTTATAVLDGTSMAAPHVAGAAALYLATHTTATPSQVSAALVASASHRRVIFPFATNTTQDLLYTLSGTVAVPAKGSKPSGSANCDGSTGGSLYSCNATYGSASPVALFWEDPQYDTSIDDAKQGLRFGGHCKANLEGVNWTINLTIGNRDGFDVANETFYCKGGQIQ